MQDLVQVGVLAELIFKQIIMQWFVREDGAL